MSTQTENATRFQQDWDAWHREREEELRQPHGWLSLTALHWLGNRPEAYGDVPGRWWFDESGIWFEPGGDAVLLDGVELTEPTAVADASGAAVGRLTTGERLFELFGRGEGNRGLRVRDPQARTRTGFDGVPAYVADAAWRIEASYTALPEVERVAVGSASERVQHVRQVIGHATFIHDGVEHRLAVSGGHAVAIAFRDATSGSETFGLLRQLAVEPADDGTVVLDFNRATNPPCSFSDYGTCPLPPPGNVLPFGVTAGERTPLRPE